jgi:hypothetical protein
METKNCPYCGEEVLATAKKCKHCGEWFTHEAKVTHERKIKSPPKYKLLKQLAETGIYLQIALILLSWFFINANSPEWQFVLYGILELSMWVLMFCLIVGVRKHYRIYKPTETIPFIPLMILMFGTYFFIQILGIDKLVLYDFENISNEFLIFLLFLTSFLIVFFIVGVQLRNKLKETRLLGIAMIICSVAQTVVAIAFGWLLIGVGTLYILYELRRFFHNESERLIIEKIRNKGKQPDAREINEEDDETIEQTSENEPKKTSEKRGGIDKNTIIVVVVLIVILGIVVYFALPPKNEKFTNNPTYQYPTTTNKPIAEKPAKENNQTKSEKSSIPTDENYLIKNDGVGIFRLGESIPFNNPNYTIKKDFVYPEGIEEPIYIVFENGQKILTITPKYDYSKEEYSTDGIDGIEIFSSKFKTAEGIGVGSTIENFANKYPDFYIWGHYNLVIETGRYGRFQFYLDENDFIGKDGYWDGGPKLGLSDFKKGSKIQGIRIY